MFNRVCCFFLAVLLFILTGCAGETNPVRENVAPLSCDVIVIGHTEAALIAALEAARRGGAVIVCYEEEYIDPWIWREGALAVLDGEEDEEKLGDELRLSIYKHGGNLGKNWHHNTLADMAGSALIWLCEETGLTLEPERPGLYRLEGVFTQAIYSRLRRAAEREGVRFLAGTNVAALKFKDPGEVAGAVV